VRVDQAIYMLGGWYELNVVLGLYRHDEFAGRRARSLGFLFVFKF